jgi:DNA repair protein RecN (Recombination protein N)
MLASLIINNVVLIDRLAIQFERGLCALTGETGAGKSILLDSLGLCLGARSESGLVRKDSDHALVAAEFDVPSTHPVFAFLRQHELNLESPLILRRSIQADGKSRAFLNDHPVSVSFLRSIGEMLVEIHGQFETQTLLNPKTHGDILDEYAGVQDLRVKVGQAWLGWQEARDSLQKRQEEIEKARAEEDYLSNALAQLEDLDPKQGEEEKLTSLRHRLMKREQTIENLVLIKNGLEQVQSTIGSLWRSMDKIRTGYDSLSTALGRLDAESQESSAQVETALIELQESDETLSDIDDRLFALKAQARKHACSIDELPQKREEISVLLKNIYGGTASLKELEDNVSKAKENYIELAKELSSQRKRAANKLDSLVLKELIPLKLENARFETSIEIISENEWAKNGIDRIQFLVATNKGANLGPLNKIASGGELARFMLALKVVLAELGAAQTLIFDEVDSGIGGATADAVGERLSRLSQKRQILVVTHSPQVAARARHHWIVQKTGKTNPTTKVLPLSSLTQRQEEIARMLAGAEITKEARSAASKLLEKSAA